MSEGVGNEEEEWQKWVEEDVKGEGRWRGRDDILCARERVWPRMRNDQEARWQRCASCNIRAVCAMWFFFTSLTVVLLFVAFCILCVRCKKIYNIYIYMPPNHTRWRQAKEAERKRKGKETKTGQLRIHKGGYPWKDMYVGVLSFLLGTFRHADDGSMSIEKENAFLRRAGSGRKIPFPWVGWLYTKFLSFVLSSVQPCTIM